MTREGMNAGQLHELLDDTPFLTRLGHTAFQAHGGTEAGFSISRYPGGDSVYSGVLMPESAAENRDLDPEKALAIDDLHRAHARFDAPFWEMLVHGHPGPGMPHHDPRQCPSSEDLELHNEINQNHPGHIGGIVTTAQLPFAFRLFLYRSGPNDINLDMLAGRYRADTPEECITLLDQAGARTARILYAAGTAKWFGKPEMLF